MGNNRKQFFFGTVILLIIISASFITRMYKASMEPQTFAYNVCCYLFSIFAGALIGFAIGSDRK